MDYTRASLTNSQLCEAFPEGEGILKNLMRDIKKELKKVDTYLKSLYADKDIPEEVKTFMTSYVEVFFLKDLHSKERIIKRQLACYNPNKSELNVELAKTIPIETLFEFKKMRKSIQRISAQCPFHDEKIPSFVIYKKNNSYHCFSCKSSGDSISFVMKLQGYNFVEAVKYLTSLRG